MTELCQPGNRLCTLRVTRLRVCGSLGDSGGSGAGSAGAGAVTLAARMHSSKRTLRSNDITVPPMDVLQRSMDMELELTSVGGKVGAGGQPVARLTITGLASTPVDHDTKNNNTLLITERGYSDEEEEGEFSSVDEADDMTYGGAAGRRAHRQLAFKQGDLSYTKLSRSRELSFRERERKIQSYIRSKEQERDSDSEMETTSKRKASSGKLAQRNLKQKFAALLRRFRVPEELADRGAARDTHHAQRDIDELFQELESLSCGEGEDSGPDQMDTISIGSTPKPSLRPFFSSSRSLANQEHHRHSNVTRHASLASAGELRPRERLASAPLTESEAVRSSAGDERASEGNSDGDVTLDAPVSGASVSSSPPNETKSSEDKRSRLFRSATSGGNLTPAVSSRKKNSLVIHTERPLSAHDLPSHSPTTVEPRRTLLEQVSRVLGEEGPGPECVAVAPPGLVRALHALGVPTVPSPPAAVPDARPLLQALLARAAKQGVRRVVRVVVCGGEAAAAAALRAHAELAARRHDAPLLRYYIIPTGVNTVARWLGAMDSTYAGLFCNESWSALCERAQDACMADVAEMSSRIARYINSIGPVNNIPIGEAMVAYRERSGDEDSSQTFVPFIAEVRVGCGEGGPSSLELDEGGSPPARPSPPATPAPASAPDLAPPLAFARTEPLELQLDYWLVGARCSEGSAAAGAGAEGGKVTLKATFRALLVTRHNHHLCITYLTKEKKQKIMRLGKKKEKPGEAEGGRAHTVEGVARLICSAKGSHNAPLKVYIDGTEWNGVKFFQLSTQWQTHVKTFPVATCGAPLAPSDS
ncbi:hypothetical protein KGM_214722 [Danaus plexippus plexippus]|uniref:Phosphofurin acidic cluster sorting protein 1/2 C-terminal domain-containing protein n=1 Tax=Danaus plexippus plexippus TaxID=278856 RepID=A0A212FHQ3_DANPL|nr:hypothetical protein KGM_214722 [Danaus plexippus plexippus]